jgi:hypothetical protein
MPAAPGIPDGCDMVDIHTKTQNWLKTSAANQ